MATERDQYELHAQASGIQEAVGQLGNLIRSMGELARASEGVASKDLLPSLDITRLRAASAMLSQLQTQIRASQEIGSKGGFANNLQRDQALTAAAARSATALAAVDKKANEERLARELEVNKQAAAANEREWQRERSQRAAVLKEMRADAVAAWGEIAAGEKAQVKNAADANIAELRREREQRKRELQGMREDANAAFGARPGSALYGRENALPQSRIDELLSPGYQQVNSSSLGRLSRRQSTLETQMQLVDADILRAEQEARTGAVSTADSERRLATLAERRASVAQQLVQTQELVRTALKEEADAQQAAAAAARQGPLASARSNFLIGFRGGQDVPYMQQMGQAVKFSLFYGTAYKALFLLTQTFQSALQEGIDFQQNLSDLAIASGKPKSSLQDLAENLAATAAATGASPAQGVQVGARSLGLYGVTGAPLDQQRFVATISNDVVSKLAASSKLDPVDLQQSIAAITQALGVGAAGQLTVADLDAYFTKKYGIGQGSTFDAVSQSASVGLAAGFKPEQIFAIAADLQSRTGATSSAVGGYLAQIFSRGGEGSLTSVAQQFGINASQPLAKVVEQLAQVYKTGNAQQQAAVAAAFGRGKVQNAAVALLNDFPDIQKQARLAQGGAANGALDKSFTERMNNIGGQLQELQGSFKEFAHLLGESGMLAALGLGIRGLRALFDVTNNLLRLYNQLPAALRDIIGLGAVALMAQRLGLGSQVLGGLGAGAAAEGAPAAFLGRYLTGTGAGAGISTAEGAAAAGGAAALGEAGIGATLLAAAPWVAAVGGVVALAQLASDAQRMHEATQKTVAAVNQAPGVGATSGQYGAYANLLRETARQDRNATGTFSQIVTFGAADNGMQARADQLVAEAKRVQQIADTLRSKEARSTAPQNLFGNFSSQDIANGLQTITDEGGTAAQQLHHLRSAINGLGEQAQKTASRINAAVLATDLAGAAGKSTGSLHYTAQVSGANRMALETGQLTRTVNENVSKYQDQIQQQLTGAVLQQRLKQQLGKLNITSYSQLTPAMINQIAGSVGSLDRSQMDLPSGTVFRPIQQAVIASIKKRLQALAGEVDKQLSGKHILTGAQAQALADAVLQAGDARQSELSTHDYTTRIQTARKTLDSVMQAYRRTDDPTPKLMQDIQTAKSKLASIQIERLEALRAVAVQNSKTQKEASARGMAIVRKEINFAVHSGDSDLLAQVISGAGKGAIAIAQHAINQAEAAARAAIAMERKVQAFYNSKIREIQQLQQQANRDIPLLHGGSYVRPDSIQAPKPTKKSGPSQSQINDLQQALNTSTYDPNADQIPKDAAAKKKADQAAKESAAQIRAARIAAMAARKGGDIAAARAAIAQARADMQDAKKGTVEYYNALASYYQARDQLNQALRSYRSTLAKLHSDITDPVVQARIAVQDALRQLRADAGKGRDVRATDKLDLKQARADLQDQAFQQRLSDIQTQEQLGQISYSAYMRYLQHEHNRLEAVKHRTRQQQDELNQIDQLMKDAAQEMQGQWNFGDIKLPTPYQIRRYIEQKAGAQAQQLATAAPGAMQGATTIYINGADTGQVIKIIDKHVGKNIRVMSTTNRRY